MKRAAEESKEEDANGKQEESNTAKKPKQAARISSTPSGGRGYGVYDKQEESNTAKQPKPALPTPKLNVFMQSYRSQKSVIRLTVAELEAWTEIRPRARQGVKRLKRLITQGG